MATAELESVLAMADEWFDRETADETKAERMLQVLVDATGSAVAGVQWPLDREALIAGDSGGLVVPEFETLWRAARGAPGQFGDDDGRQWLVTVFHPPRGFDGLLWLATAPGGHWDQSAPRLLRVVSEALNQSRGWTGYPSGQPVPTDPERFARRLDGVVEELAAFAHGFNNILTAVMGFNELMMPMVARDSDASLMVAEIAKAGRQAAELNRRIHALRFAGIRSSPSASSKVAAAVESARRLMPPGVALDVDLPPELPEVAMARESLQAVLGAILANAVEASPASAAISITARVVRLSARDCASVTGRCRPGPHVELTIADQGPGLSPDVRARLFNDVFVTSKSGRHGLGVTTAFRILFVHDAGLRLESGAAVGTVARIFLPVAAPARPLPGGSSQ